MTKKKATPLNKDTHTPRRRGLVIGGAIVAVLLLVAALFGGWYWWFQSTYKLEFYPGVRVLDIDLEGKTVDAAKIELQERVDRMQADGIVVSYATESGESVELPLPPTMIPLDSAAVELELYAYDIDATLSSAYAVGRQGGRFLQLRDQLSARSGGHDVELHYAFNRDRVIPLVQDTFAAYESPAKNADIFVEEDGSIKTKPEEMGLAFNLDAIADDVEQAVRTMDAGGVSIQLEDDAPMISEAEIDANRELIETYVSYAPIILTYEEKEWSFDGNAIASWLSFQSDALAVHPKRLEESITNVIDDVHIEPKEGRWEPVIEGEKVTELTTLVEPEEGQAVNLEATAQALTGWFQHPRAHSIELSVDVTKPKYTLESVNELGIEDVLGSGTSSAAGSPPNRIVNIARGAELLNGLIIEPEEEFSLNNALRPYTAENGYLAELVIVGNKTIPEYGGGLCQVGTTTFRASMNSGLDITERSPHSYAVSYYFEENGLPGTDATIYDGAVDYKFYNDTGNAILFNTVFDDAGTLLFTFSGKSDGRQGYYTMPTISGWEAPPAAKEILTDDLPPGVRDCTESAHNGTSAQFTYIIDYLDGKQHEETFTSYYKPWQAVCRVGKEKEEEEKPEEQEAPKEKPVEEPKKPNKKN